VSRSIRATNVGETTLLLCANLKKQLATHARHIAKVCKSSPKKQTTRLPDGRPRETHQVDHDTEETENFVDEELDTYPMFNLQAKRSKPLMVTPTDTMELDTGTSL